MNGYGIIAPNTFGKITGAPEPICEPMDAIAEAVAWATCTSDPHQVHAGLPAGLILGHEVVARLVKVGTMVKDFKVGDIVCVGAVTPDWTWPNCQDNIHQDANGAAQGMNWCVTENGTFAERFRIRQVDCNATYIPKSLTYEHALMASDMVTTGFHGVEMAHVTWGDTVVVKGNGPVGLMSVAGSALRGAGRIIAIGRRPITLELAKEYGATDVLNYTDGPIDEQVLELTGGVAPDCCITTGGTNDTFARCLKMVKPNGIVSNLQAQTFDTEIPGMYTLYWQSHKQVNGGLCPGGRKRMQRLLSIMEAGRLDPTKLITHRFHGMEHIMDAYNMMDVKPDDMVKPVIYND